MKNEQASKEKTITAEQAMGVMGPEQRHSFIVSALRDNKLEEADWMWSASGMRLDWDTLLRSLMGNKSYRKADMNRAWSVIKSNPTQTLSHRHAESVLFAPLRGADAVLQRHLIENVSAKDLECIAIKRYTGWLSERTINWGEWKRLGKHLDEDTLKKLSEWNWQKTIETWVGIEEDAPEQAKEWRLRVWEVVESGWARDKNFEFEVQGKDLREKLERMLLLGKSGSVEQGQRRNAL
jgi:hypothetical protein